jgi:DNA primase catalytic core
LTGFHGRKAKHMARIPKEEIERLKRETDLAALVRASGVELAPHGANGDLIGRCPLHDDRTPSLVVTPAKGLWHCLGACGIGGSAIDWIMRTQKSSFRYAIEVLREIHSAGVVGRTAPTSTGSGQAVASLAKRLPPPVSFDAEDRELMVQVIDYYYHRLKQTPDALAYLQKRGIGRSEAIEQFKIGYSDRTLGLRLPNKQRKTGAEIRTRLEKLGLFRATGREHFNGCVVFPVIDPASGHVTEIYGRKIGRQSKGLPYHLYQRGRHQGVWNEKALAASDEIILCESIIDALTFWCAGFRNVTSSYGTNGFTSDHLAAFKRYGTRRVLIAYDRDEAGENGALKLWPQLAAEGIECYRVQFPKGMDANEYALKLTPASKSLDLVVRNAVWLGNGAPGSSRRVGTAVEAPEAEKPAACPELVEAAKEESIAEPSVEDAPTPAPPASSRRAGTSEATKEETMSTRASHYHTPACSLSVDPAPLPAIDPSPAPLPSLAASTSSEQAADPGPLNKPEWEPPASAEALPSASPSPRPSAPPAVPAEIKEQGIVITVEDRRYRIRGMEKNLGFDALRVNLLASRGEALHVDTLDLYGARSRKQFITDAARELCLEEKVLKHDLGKVLLKLEELQEKQIAEAMAPKVKNPISDAQCAAALALLKAPDLLDRILADFERCGIVGEATNKLTGYLAATSRKLEQPLAVVVQSSSAAGKSSLMEAVLAMLPAEEVIKFSAMTGQSLFYMQGSDLKHKVLAIVEEEGAERASYALKLLQSEGELTIASTGKDPQTGRLVTQEYRVEGPVMIFLTTTAAEIDEELLNRCLVLSVNEEREQTRAIHAMQRHRQTLEGLLEQRQRAAVLQVHRDAQRLLRPMLVANPFAGKLTFQDNRTRSRRDHVKYLTLIRTVALLHQYQREHKTIASPAGQLIEYIEVTPADIAIANKLTHEVLGRSLDELAPQTRRLLVMLQQHVGEQCQREKILRQDYRFSRRDVRTWIGWSDFVVRTHLQKLVDLEYVLVHRGGRGQSFVYELLYGGEGTDGKPFALGLIDPESLTGLEAEGKALPLGRAVDSRAVEQKDRAYVEKFAPPAGKFEHEKGRFEVGSRPHSAPIEGGSCAGESAQSPGPAEPECTSHVEAAEIALGETPSGASQRTDAIPPLPSLAASLPSSPALLSPALLTSRQAAGVNHVI